MENNGLFNAVLRGLGFRVYSAGARVNSGDRGGGVRGEGYGGW